MKKAPSRNLQIRNRKASFDYFFIETFVAGMSLQGTEVKSIREGKCTLTDSYCLFTAGELVIHNLDIPTSRNSFQHEPKRNRRLLLNKKELRRIERALAPGITVIPLRIFEIGGWFKCEIAIARGKKNYDKRETIKERDVKREMDRL
jgi:SsrA-binding protein